MTVFLSHNDIQKKKTRNNPHKTNKQTSNQNKIKHKNTHKKTNIKWEDSYSLLEFYDIIVVFVELRDSSWWEY